MRFSDAELEAIRVLQGRLEARTGKHHTPTDVVRWLLARADQPPEPQATPKPAKAPKPAAAGCLHIKSSLISGGLRKCDACAAIRRADGTWYQP